MRKKRSRSKLSQPEARRRYVEIGELAVLQQIEKDSKALDDNAIAVGPFGRLDAAAVAARDGKTRGAVTNLFGSQAVFQAETMKLALNAAEWIEMIEYPSPSAFQSPDAWIDALFAAESARGPRHAAEPAVNYAFLWALWLSAVPYGIWSERVSGPSVDEFVQWVQKLEQLFAGAIDHFGMRLRKGISVNHLATSAATLIEGAWLNQCLTLQHPCDAKEAIATVLTRAGRLLWNGATELRT
ncbi:MAG TPA: hypothetical protein VNS34_04875 [Rhizobiaceae bacterium]|nr:hypothetical protein [Rhizobiaceae bacterium]